MSVSAQFSLPVLPYSYDALEPYIDSETMNIHYNNHHATYVKNLNEALAKHPELQNRSIEELIRDINSLPSDVRTAIRNNGGGHYNHTLFWSILAPAGSTQMSANLRQAIERDFGSVDAFKKQFEEAASGRFGSGWAWLIKDNNGRLQITSTPNQDNPIMSVAEMRGTPILGLDVWEHAYYLKYQSKRADYIKAFWDVVNWNEVERLFNINRISKN
ncbi:MAG: superoxide dismutase [Bacteroidales bacterium]|nr:superoxide dismutase [Bacteroidales bacterium]